jgi:hypothetical protein
VIATLIALLKCEQPAGKAGPKDKRHGEPHEHHNREPGTAPKGRDSCSKETPTAVTDGLEAAYTDDERPSWGSLAQRGSADRPADGNARRDDFLLRGVLAPLPFGSALGKTQ